MYIHVLLFSLQIGEMESCLLLKLIFSKKIVKNVYPTLRYQCFGYLIILNIILTNSSYAKELINANDLHHLNKSEIIRLRDFVRGKGSVSRVPYNFGDDDEFPQIELLENQNIGDKNDSDVINFGQQVWTMVPEKSSKISPNLSALPQMSFALMPMSVNNRIPDKSNKNPPHKQATITPTLERKNAIDEPTEEDYEKLAKILQEFINHRKPVHSSVRHETHTSDDTLNTELRKVTITQSTTSKIISDNSTSQKAENFAKTAVFPKENISIWPGMVEKAQLKTEKIEFSGGSTTSKLPAKEFHITPTEHEKYAQEEPNNDTAINNELETKLNNVRRELIIMLHKDEKLNNLRSTGPQIVKPIREPNYKENVSSKAYVTILREGIARQTSSNQYIFVASITLIRHAGKTILVDTGLATDINGRTDMIKKLSKMNIAPPAVDYVVTTHGHPDHSGNTNDFPDAVHFQGTMSHFRNKFNFTDLFENNKHKITPNVVIIKTPGHTSEDISVIVYNTDKYGTMAIVGDVFIAAEDMDYPMMWRPLAWNEQLQEKSRQELICFADYIVPGHGKVFKVSDALRNRFYC